MSSNAWKVAMTKAASEVAEHLSTPEDVIWAEDAASRILSLPEPPEFRAAVEAERGEVVEMLREATAAWEAVLALEENTSPFGGEIMRDRIERTMERAKASVAKARALLSRIGGEP